MPSRSSPSKNAPTHDIVINAFSFIVLFLTNVFTAFINGLYNSSIYPIITSILFSLNGSVTNVPNTPSTTPNTRFKI